MPDQKQNCSTCQNWKQYDQTYGMMYGRCLKPRKATITETTADWCCGNYSPTQPNSDILPVDESIRMLREEAEDTHREMDSRPQRMAAEVNQDVFRACYGKTPVFPIDPELSKQVPVFTGLLMYFPHACAAVAAHSFKGNEQHNPGEPMHWAKEKSIGDGNQVVRHLMEGDLEAAAWRAMELLERKLTGLPPFEARRDEK